AGAVVDHPAPAADRVAAAAQPATPIQADRAIPSPGTAIETKAARAVTGDSGPAAQHITVASRGRARQPRESIRSCDVTAALDRPAHAQKSPQPAAVGTIDAGARAGSPAAAGDAVTHRGGRTPGRPRTQIAGA